MTIWLYHRTNFLFAFPPFPVFSLMKSSDMGGHFSSGIAAVPVQHVCFTADLRAVTVSVSTDRDSISSDLSGQCSFKSHKTYSISLNRECAWFLFLWFDLDGTKHVKQTATYLCLFIIYCFSLYKMSLMVYLLLMSDIFSKASRFCFEFEPTDFVCWN